MTFLAIKKIQQILEDYTLLELCWATKEIPFDFLSAI